MKRVEVNDAGAMAALGNIYYHGNGGLLQDPTKALELYARAAALGSSNAHFHLCRFDDDGGDLTKAKFHYEAATMAGHEVARCNLGTMEAQSGNVERAVKHYMNASSGCYRAMHTLRTNVENGFVCRESIDSSLRAYNKSCAEMRSDTRDAAIRLYITSIGAR